MLEQLDSCFASEFNIWYLMMVQILWSLFPSGDYSGSDRPQLRCFRWDAISWRWPVESPSSWLGEAASFSSPEEQTVHWWRERSSAKIINRGGFFLYFGERILDWFKFWTFAEHRSECNWVFLKIRDNVIANISRDRPQKRGKGKGRLGEKGQGRG